MLKNWDQETLLLKKKIQVKVRGAAGLPQAKGDQIKPCKVMRPEDFLKEQAALLFQTPVVPEDRRELEAATPEKRVVVLRVILPLK